jgi:hypothetical protein
MLGFDKQNRLLIVHQPFRNRISDLEISTAVTHVGAQEHPTRAVIDEATIQRYSVSLQSVTAALDHAFRHSGTGAAKALSGKVVQGCERCNRMYCLSSASSVTKNNSGWQQNGIPPGGDANVFMWGEGERDLKREHDRGLVQHYSC